MVEGYSWDETVLVRWFPYHWYHYTGDSGVDHEPVEFLYIPCRYKCWGKGI